MPVTFYIGKASLPPPKKQPSYRCFVALWSERWQGRVISTEPSDVIQMPDEARKKARLPGASPISAALRAGRFSWDLRTARRAGYRCASHE